jgi:hypothetical protein
VSQRKWKQELSSESEAAVRKIDNRSFLSFPPISLPSPFFAPFALCWLILNSLVNFFFFLGGFASRLWWRIFLEEEEAIDIEI